MQEMDMGASTPVVEQRSSVVDRAVLSIGERLRAYTHAVSDEAQAQLDLVMEGVAGSPLAASLESVRPMVRERLRGADRGAVVSNLIVTALKTGYGVASFFAAREALRSNMAGRVATAAVHGLVGAGAIAWGAVGMRNVGGGEKRMLGRYTSRLQRYYRTEAGQRAAHGKGTGDRESLTSQVDRIIRRMTLGVVPTVSG